MEDYERAGLFALLVKRVEAQVRRDNAHEAIRRAQADIAEANSDISNIASGLRVFGIDARSGDAWGLVKEALGHEQYRRALKLGGMGVKAAELQPDEQPPPSNTQVDDGTDGRAGDGAEEDATGSTVREITLRYLAEAGEAGLTARFIMDEIEKRGLEIHEKTVGMTLYRLSKLKWVERDGRTWKITEAGVRAVHKPSAESSEAAPSLDIFG